MKLAQQDPIVKIIDQLAGADYIADPAIATSIYLAQSLGRPLLIEGRAGVGKTEVATVMAKLLDTKLIRLQCYEGLDVTTALYEWNYPSNCSGSNWMSRAGRVGAAPRSGNSRFSASRSSWNALCWRL